MKILSTTLLATKRGDRPVQMFQRIGLHPDRLFGKYLTITGTCTTVHTYKIQEEEDEEESGV